jgi:hypothetical protein
VLANQGVEDRTSCKAERSEIATHGERQVSGLGGAMRYAGRRCACDHVRLISVQTSTTCRKKTAPAVCVCASKRRRMTPAWIPRLWLRASLDDAPRNHLDVTAVDRDQFEAIGADRNSPQKHVWRAAIVLATADGAGRPNARICWIRLAGAGRGS